jgi:predicted nucleic acid-binding protein
MLVLLDSNPLSMVTYAVVLPEIGECNEWLEGLLTKGVAVLVPEIIDYELRRELIRTNNRDSIELLNALAADIGYLRLNSDTYLIAAAMWAEVRGRGLETAPPQSIDIDCILAAQARQVSTIEDDVRIATVDVDDLSRYDTDRVTAMLWRNIT